MQTGSDAFPQGKAGMKRAYGILENHLQLSVQFFLPTGRQMGDIVAIEENLPTVGLGELADEPAQCTFSRPAFSDDSHDFCFLQLKRNIIDGTERDAAPFIGFYEMVYFEEHGEASFLMPARVRRCSV